CDELKVTLNIMNGKMQCLLEDNGKGFDTSTQSFGYGLNNMKARAEELGGELHVRSTDQGTLVDFSIPQ
ncbi:MAG: ATP-binding protein, partial [Flavobacteriales bacterium]